MDDEDGRCLLDVICDPQALNDFLHGSDKIDGDDLLDNTGDAASAFFVGTGLHVQETPGNHLTTEPNQSAGGVDLDFLPDDILGSPSAASASLANSDQPCDILQQSLQEANITEQTLEAEAELDLGSFQLPTLQPVVPSAPDGTPQLFSGGGDLIGLQQPAVLTHQALVQQSVGADVVNKAISVQPFIQQVGLGNVTIQPLSNLPGLPNGSPGGALGIGQIQVVGQQVMAINQPTQHVIAKQVQPTQVANLPVGSYLTGGTAEQQQVTLTSSGVSPQNAGLVLQNKIPTVATTLNGSSMFGSMSTTQCTQSLTVTSSLNSPVIIQRTPTPIQPKPAGVLQQKLFQISPKPFNPNNTTLTIQGEAALQQQQKAQQNLTFMAGKAGQNVVLSGFPQGLPANVFKQPPPQQQTLGKPMSVQLLNQGSSIVIPAQHAQAMLQGQNQFLLPGASTVQQLSALQANMSGQILAASHASGQAHIIASQGPGGQLLNQTLPAQILTNQNLANQLNLGQVLTSQNAHGTAHILSGPIQLQAGQVGQPTLFQMPVSLASSLSTQSQPAVTTSLNQAGQTVIQGVTLPNQVAMFNPSDGIGQAVSIQQASAGSSQSPGMVQGASLLPSTEQTSILTVQTTQQASQGQAQLQLNVQQQPPQQPLAPPPPQQAMPSPSIDPSSEKIIISQATPGNIISAESMQMFLQQKEQQQLYEAALKSQQESSLVQTSAAPHLTMPIYSIAVSGSTLSSSTSSSSSVPASVIVSSSAGSAAQSNRELAQNHTTTPESKGHLPHFPASQSQQAMSCQIPTGQQKLPGASPSHTLPHPPSPQLQASASHHSQMQSPHQSRPPSRPPSRPHSRPPSQPQSLARPPSEPLSRSCTPQMQNLFVIQNQISSSPHGSSQHPLRPPSQPQVQTPFPPHQPLSAEMPQTLSSPQQHVQLQVQLSTSQPDNRPGVPISLQATPPTSDSSQTHSFPVQFQAQASIKHQGPGQPIHITQEQQRTFQMTPSQFQALTLANTLPQQKQMLERYQQMQQQQSLMIQSQQSQGGAQTSPALAGQYNAQSSSLMISGQGQQVPTQVPLHGHSPGQVLVQQTAVSHGDLTKVQTGVMTQAAQLSTLLQQQQQQQQASVLVKTSGATSAPGPQDASIFPNTTGKPSVVQGKPINAVPVHTQAKTGVISSVPTISLGKGSLQIQVVGKGISQIVPASQVQTQTQFDSKFGTLKKLQTLQPSKEACFLEQLHKHQGTVLHPDYKTPFHSFEDALHRLLPYHVYQGLLPNPNDLSKVDDEFETMSTQLLKRTQAMLNKYRLLLLEESRRVSPSAEMVMIDRMFIQEEKVALSLDRQLAKERPDEYVSSSSRSQTVTPSVTSVSSSPCPAPAAETQKPTAMQTSTPIHPTKLVIKHSSGGSPSVTWAKASPSLDADDDALPSRSRPPIKTYEARSRIGLKLKIKQEAGLSKVIHNTALDPVHHNPPPPPPPPAPPTTPASTVIKTTVNPTPATVTTTTPTGQMNGTLDHSSPVEKKPMATFCRLPLRKTYRENVDAFVTGKPTDTRSAVETPAQVPVMTQAIKQEDECRSVITSHKVQGIPESVKVKKEESPKLVFFSRGESKMNSNEETTMSLRRDPKDDEPGFYRPVVKSEPRDHESELNWEMTLPSAKRLKSEQFDVDNASFSSDSPQDDTLNEHLQSAIDSILNLQQPQSGGNSNALLRSSAQSSYHHSSSSSPFSSPVHRTDSYLTPNHNGGLGARTLNR